MAESEILYHYTSAQAFISIMERKCLWMSSRHNQNDSNEGRVFGDRLRELAKSESLSKSVEDILNELADFESYVACFSSKGDLLSQWRGYASNATGVSVGFKRSALFELIKGDSQALLRPVSYADRAEDLKDETKKLMRALLRSEGNPTEEFRMSAAKVMWELKNRAFEEEAESRLIFTVRASTLGQIQTTLKSGTKVVRKYRATDSGVREYCEIDIARLLPDAVTEVIIGPRSDSHLDVVERLLRAVGCKACVRRSAATYK